MASDGMQLSLVGMGMSARTYGVRADLGGGGVDFEVLGNTQSDPTWRRLFGVDGYGAPPGGNPYDRLKVYDDSGANQKKVWNEGNLPIASGSWTPSILFTGGVTIIGYDSRAAQWFRVGNLVFVHIAVSTTTVSGASGDVRISAPPLAGKSGMAQLLTIRTANIPIASGHVPYAYVRAGETAISVAVMRSNTGTLTIKADDWGSNGGVIITGVYLTDDP